MRKVVPIVVSLLLLQTVIAEEIEQYFLRTALNYLLLAFAVIAILVVVSIYIQHRASNLMKMILFWSIIVLIAVPTLYSATTTIYINVKSHTKGPVHWHADFEVWKCGEKQDLIDPTGFSNRVGTPTLHEHGDDRIHVEGVVMELQDVSLSEFLRVTGGSLTNTRLEMPTNTDPIVLEKGEMCNGKPAELQVFVYTIKNPFSRRDWEFEQTKVTDFTSYILSPYVQVPPGDCIIIELDEPKESTDKFCETYRVAEQRGELRGG